MRPPASLESFASEGVLVAGAARAIVLQVADPVVAAAVTRHSDFAHRPLDRLSATLTYVYAVLLGTPEEASQVAARVERAHAPVARANDEDRQLWVAATLYDTAVTTHERVFGHMPDELSDDLYQSYASLGTALRVRPDRWPADRAAFESYRVSTLAQLTITDDARRIVYDLFHPVEAPIWLRACLPLASLLTASLLDAPIRDAYGLPWTTARERRARRAWAVLRVLVRMSPRRLRQWPARHYLAAMRAASVAHPANED